MWPEAWGLQPCRWIRCVGDLSPWVLGDALDMVVLEKELVSNLKSAYFISLASDKIEMTSTAQPLWING